MVSFEDIVKRGTYTEDPHVKAIFCDRCHRTEITVYCRFESKDLCMLCCSQIIKLYKITEDEIFDKTYNEKIKNDKVVKKDLATDMLFSSYESRYTGAVTKMSTNRFKPKCVIS